MTAKQVTATQIRHDRVRNLRHPGQGGFSLVEMMIAMAIISILITTAVVTIDTEPDVDDVAHLLANKINEGVRQAIAGGPVDPQFILDTGMDGRTHMQITTDAAGNQFLLMGRLNEAIFTFLDTNQVYIPGGIEIVGYDFSAVTTPTGAGPSKLLGPTDIVTFYGRPDGSIFAMENFSFDRHPSTTLFLRSKKNPGDRARIVVLPLGGVPLVLSGW